MWTLAWSLKISKLCNLRCRYCYEWNELANADRIPLSQWADILLAVRRYHALLTDRFGEPGRAYIYWHGGEPLLLPMEYFETALRLEHEVLGHESLESRQFVNRLQTNLYSLPERKLALLERERFEIGVSLDVVPGQRLTTDCRETEDRVVANMRRLRDRGMPFSGAVVLAGHTRARLKEIYDFYEGLGVRFTLFPLGPSPLNTSGAAFAVSDSEIIEALKELFVYWIDRGAAIRVQPLQTYLDTALLHLTGLDREPYDRQAYGERVLVVNTDGTLYTIADRYAPEMAVGNIFRQSLDEILDSPAYAASLDRDCQRRRQHCDGCTYRGACDTYPLFAEPYEDRSRRCRIAFELIAFIERYLREAGLGEPELVEAALRDNGLTFTPICRVS
jgi:uncharacterized protein